MSFLKVNDKLVLSNGAPIEVPDPPPLQPSKSLTVTSNGTVSITPDTPYDAMQKVDLTVDVAGSGGAEEATLTISLRNYVSQQWAGFFYVTPSGELVAQDPVNTQITFPATITTVKGGMVCLVTSGWKGLPFPDSTVGVTAIKRDDTIVCKVNDSQASVTIINMGN